ncbi:hypothetical protein [Desulfosporosinus sp. OT]|uniref:hypothetical protein n=1 Tax=Desulfosporosinus sp. OT TaxID=913865 RepID=UPI0002239E46|nr:hypothetical protein [Desulfosporosinus sp. OT]EGW39373.1 hypothetical protein DOT_2658 [Desulfosporosinus sp. OT]
MTGFFSNPWVVGIGGGIFSGFIVFLVTRFAFSNRDKMEYFRNLTTANKEVIYSIRSIISENVLPSSEIINALIRANSRRYRVDQKDMYTLVQICEELIKEIMDSSFIASKIKLEYCDMLSGIKTDKKEMVINTDDDKLSSATYMSESYQDEYKNKLITEFSLILGLLAAMVPVVIYIIPGLESPFTPVVTVVFVALIVTIGSVGLIHKRTIRFEIDRNSSSRNRNGNNDVEKLEGNKHEDAV